MTHIHVGDFLQTDEHSGPIVAMLDIDGDLVSGAVVEDVHAVVIDAGYGFVTYSTTGAVWERPRLH